MSMPMPLRTPLTDAKGVLTAPWRAYLESVQQTAVDAGTGGGGEAAVDYPDVTDLVVTPAAAPRYDEGNPEPKLDITVSFKTPADYGTDPSFAGVMPYVELDGTKYPQGWHGLGELPGESVTFTLTVPWQAGEFTVYVSSGSDETSYDAISEDTPQATFTVPAISAIVVPDVLLFEAGTRRDDGGYDHVMHWTDSTRTKAEIDWLAILPSDPSLIAWVEIGILVTDPDTGAKYFYDKTGPLRLEDNFGALTEDGFRYAAATMDTDAASLAAYPGTWRVVAVCYGKDGQPNKDANGNPTGKYVDLPVLAGDPVDFNEPAYLEAFSAHSRWVAGKLQFVITDIVGAAGGSAPHWADLYYELPDVSDGPPGSLAFAPLDAVNLGGTDWPLKLATRFPIDQELPWVFEIDADPSIVSETYARLYLNAVSNTGGALPLVRANMDLATPNVQVRIDAPVIENGTGTDYCPNPTWISAEVEYSPGLTAAGHEQFRLKGSWTEPTDSPSFLGGMVIAYRYDWESYQELTGNETEGSFQTGWNAIIDTVFDLYLVGVGYDSDGRIRRNALVPGVTPVIKGVRIQPQIVISGDIDGSRVRNLPTAALAAGIEPVTIVTASPTGTTLSIAKTTNAVYNTTDRKLYRWDTVAGAYRRDVLAGDLAANSVTAGAIAVDAVTAGTIAAAAVNTRELAAGELLVGQGGGKPTRFKVVKSDGSPLMFIGDDSGVSFLGLLAWLGAHTMLKISESDEFRITNDFYNSIISLANAQLRITPYLSTYPVSSMISGAVTLTQSAGGPEAQLAAAIGEAGGRLTLQTSGSESLELNSHGYGSGLTGTGASGGSASIPSNPVEYLCLKVNGNNRKIALYGI